MARRNRKKNKIKFDASKNSRQSEGHRLHPDTKKSIVAIIFLGIAALLILASFKSAGPAGNFVYGILENFFGWGYYLLPLIGVILAGVFLMSERRRIYKITFLGALLLIFSGLGLIDIVFPEQGGIVGKLIGALEIPFGFTASLVIVIIIAIISFLITLNLPIRIKSKSQAQGEEQEELEIKSVITSPLSQQQIEAEMVSEETETIEEQESEILEPAESKKVSSAISSVLSRAFKRPEPVKTKTFKNYIAPPLDLLKSSVEKPTVGDLRANANIIKRTLESFGIPVEMGEINIGPKVTRYTLKPAEGIKLARITALNQDLALALAAHPIRIEAPIPGKSLVGIEVPNKAAALVRLGSLITYPAFMESGALSFVLGRDINGEPLFTDIEKMPHLLIAGATGSGKSIMLHSLLVSLLYKNSPENLRLVLIDPKRVELSVYENIPHLIAPVIMDAKKALGVFRWAINEMEKRYELLLQAGCRDIKSYNKKSQENPLPYILIVVDELADLMASYGREIEGSVIRLAQMARATGLHLIVSTQRPSVEVLTGLIKANITSRIALQVASQVDSRTILDMAGAEKLLGGGDMLFISSEFSKPKRIQGAYIPDEEIKKVADFIRDNNKGLEKEEDVVFNGQGNGSEVGVEQYLEYSGEDEDELLEEAIRVVAEAKKASASLLQRRLKVGYARAARLLDIMEAKGIIGPGEGAKPREVYVGQDNEE